MNDSKANISVDTSAMLCRRSTFRIHKKIYMYYLSGCELSDGRNDRCHSIYSIYNIACIYCTAIQYSFTHNFIQHISHSSLCYTFLFTCRLCAHTAHHRQIVQDITIFAHFFFVAIRITHYFVRLHFIFYFRIYVLFTCPSSPQSWECMSFLFPSASESQTARGKNIYIANATILSFFSHSVVVLMRLGASPTIRFIARIEKCTTFRSVSGCNVNL